MKSIHILLIEDNEGDILLTVEALSESNYKNEVTVIKDGDAAINYFQNAISENKSLPDLVLLDINLPKIDGKEVLSFIKTHPKLKIIPVLMLTTSSSDADIRDAYSNYANCYITKPVDFNNFFEIIKSIEDFWITMVKLPAKV
ncbi:MAG TPA: response regulator [Segetibacter sp.]|jgi:CheY-like chemotaxis protein